MKFWVCCRYVFSFTNIYRNLGILFFWIFTFHLDFVSGIMFVVVDFLGGLGNVPNEVYFTTLFSQEIPLYHLNFLSNLEVCKTSDSTWYSLYNFIKFHPDFGNNLVHYQYYLDKRFYINQHACVNIRWSLVQGNILMGNCETLLSIYTSPNVHDLNNIARFSCYNQQSLALLAERWDSIIVQRDLKLSLILQVLTQDLNSITPIIDKEALLNSLNVRLKNLNPRDNLQLYRKLLYYIHIIGNFS